MDVFHTYDYPVQARDTDPFNQCRPSALLSLLQEAATSAACSLGVAREGMLERYNVFWMLARIWYRLDQPAYWDDRITLKTWHRGGRGAAMYRDYDIFLNGELAGEAVATWVLADQDTRKLFRLSKVMEFEGTTGGSLCKTKLLNRLHLPESMAFAEDRQVHYSDADVNGHVNNARYADFVCDALHLEALGKGRFVSSLQVGYQAECRPGETLRLSTGGGDGSWYVRGAGQGGEERFSAALTLEELKSETQA